MFATYRVDWFPRYFLYNLPLYYNSFFYKEFIVHARYVGRKQLFTGFQKKMKSRKVSQFNAFLSGLKLGFEIPLF